MRFAASDSITHRVKRLTLASGKVASIKFEIKFGAEDGVLLVDNLTLWYSADSSTRGSGLLSVPEAPAAK